MTTNWRTRAACRDHPNPDVFHPQPGDTPARRAAKAICGRCPVTHECLDWAQRHNITHGVWGGQHLDGLPEHHLPDDPTTQRHSCGTTRGITLHRRHNEPLCQPCRVEADRAYRAKYARTYARLERKTHT